MSTIAGRRGGRAAAVAALAAAGVAWGTSIPLSKVALAWLAPGWVSVTRFGLAAAVLLVLAARRGNLKAALTVSVAASGAVGYGLSVVLQNAGVARTSVTHASVLVGAAPVLVAVIAALWRRQVARPLSWAGLALSLGGVVLITGGGGPGSSAAGDALVLGSVALCAGITVIQDRLLPGRDPVAVTAVQFLGAALVSLPFAGAEGLPSGHPSMGALAATLALTGLGTVAPFSLFAYGQKRVRAEVAGAFFNLEPLVGAIAGVLAFGDPFGARQAAGGAAVIAGIALGCVPLLAGPGRAAPRLRRPRRARLAPSPAVLPGPAVVPGPAIMPGPAVAAAPAVLTAGPGAFTQPPGPLPRAA